MGPLILSPLFILESIFSVTKPHFCFDLFYFGTLASL